MLHVSHFNFEVAIILTTIKLNKKPEDVQIKASKPPVRSTHAALRNRSIATSKVNQPIIKKPEVEVNLEEQFSSNQNAAKQRNHRFDGKLHENIASQNKQKSHRSYSAQAANERDPQPQEKLQGVDRRITPRPNKDEPQYRQAPRRGGKMRDGYDALSQSRDSGAKKSAYQSASASTDLPRLSKVMAERGICSRREADEWIMNSWVMVDGVIIDKLGTRIRPDAEIVISSYAHEVQAETVTIILHKPVGYVSGQAEDGYQPAIVLIHPDNEWMDSTKLNPHYQQTFKRSHLKGLAPAGRLDIDSTGMLVLTQDGRIARHLISEESTVEKEYLVRVEGALDADGLKRLNHGLSLDGEKLKPAKVSWQNEDQLRFVLREGKKRQIRRMCEMVGLHVVGLKRVRIGSVNLGQLPVGQWRYLGANERF